MLRVRDAHTLTRNSSQALVGYKAYSMRASVCTAVCVYSNLAFCIAYENIDYDSRGPRNRASPSPSLCVAT